MKVNFLKFLGEERRQCVLDFAKDKINSDSDFKVFSFLVKQQSNILSELVPGGKKQGKRDHYGKLIL